MLSVFRILSFFSFILTTSYFTLPLTRIHAATFEMQNNCIYTVWAAAVPGGGRELRQGQTWVVNSDPNSYKAGVIWARTNCNFNEKGIGKCETGDCDGLYYCVSSPTLNKTSPTTLAEYSFPESRNNPDFFDITLVNGFNVPMEFRASSTTCSQGVKCTADINSLCPTELRDPGGCNHPCTVFNNDQFCCRNSNNCGPSAYFKFFKDLCPNVYTYALDDANSTFSCPSGTNYTVTFCP